MPCEAVNRNEGRPALEGGLGLTKIGLGGPELGQFDLGQSAQQQRPGKAGPLELAGGQAVLGSQPVL